MINDIFNFCVYVLQVIGQVTGWGYELANIIIFVVVQPFLILLFFTLWIKSYNEKRNDLHVPFVEDCKSFHVFIKPLLVENILSDKYFKFEGLNLTLETLDGLIKHNGPVTKLVKINLLKIYIFQMNTIGKVN